MGIRSFIERRPYLIWHTRNFKHLSREAALEAVLNYGDFEDVKKIIAILGKKTAAGIFQKQLRQHRVNYDSKIINYFARYFRKYA